MSLKKYLLFSTLTHIALIAALVFSINLDRKKLKEKEEYIVFLIQEEKEKPQKSRLEELTTPVNQERKYEHEFPKTIVQKPEITAFKSIKTIPEKEKISQMTPPVLRTETNSGLKQKIEEEQINEIKENPKTTVQSSRIDEDYFQISTNKSTEDYISRVYSRINQFIFYPRTARLNNIQGRNVLELTLLNNGNIQEIRVIEPARYDILNKTSIEILKRASPFPPLLGEPKDKTFSLTIPFNYNLK